MGEKLKKKAKNIRLTKNYKSIEASLLDQLERTGNNTAYFRDLVSDYMKMYETKELCYEDIKTRGNYIESIGSQGQKVTKKNDSIDMLLKTNQQMIKLLDMLNIKAESGEAADDFEL